MTLQCVLIHGFTGSPASWDPVVAALPADWSVVRPAVAGHDPRRGWPAGVDTFADEVARLAREIPAGPPTLLCGYSLGGRLALGLLAREPARFAAALGIGAHPGLPADGGGEDEDAPADQPRARRGGRLSERAQRLAEDERRAAQIEHDFEGFLAGWEALPLFASQRRLPPAVLAAQARVRGSHRPQGLARALRVLSLGAMPDHRPALSALRAPVVLMAGELDQKFGAVASELASSMPHARVERVPGVGHNVPLEAPAVVAAELRALAEQVGREGSAG